MSTPLPRQKPSAVIFDMDGTTVRHLDERLINIVEWLDDRIYYASNFFPRLFQGKGAANTCADDYLDERARCKKPRLIGHKALHHLRRKNVEQLVEPSPDIHLVLNTLKRHNIPMGLASNGLGTGYGHDVLKTFDLDHYFEATVFREDIRKSKPDPESILLTLRSMGVELHKGDVIWYIGDRRKDVKAAISAGKVLDCTVVPIAYTINASLQIFKEDYSPDHIIMDYRDMNRRLIDFIASGTTDV